MLLRTYIPRAPLSMFVDYFWYIEGYNPAHSKELALPDGSVEVVINLMDDSIRLYNLAGKELNYGSSVLCGPHSEYFLIDNGNESKVLGIHFKPGGLRPFINEPLDEILNIHVSLDLLWGLEAHRLRNELLEAKIPERMFPVLERRLIALAVQPFEQEPAVLYALHELHHLQVSEVIDNTGWSHRRFNQLFKENVGMPPKRLSRIYRFQNALHFIDSREHISWLDIAIACNYYDQAHFIKDFQAFSGLNPSLYKPIDGRHHNHAELSM
ncbi:AraC family transcriptional regulator [Paenibacillus psychroresistens]|uniref:AraC family transcriptional regulator n=1 Tax=Paenibacillus psychroresistens TaxID=1778678 RepID=A0A6B8RQY7_9BACL|nr:helix-turn-helix domain-containing protein [Paenibacillus psychroresistens]QGQ98224.1 AraC family transcriptional regulator [Paenibacillus psychroresistens]